MSGQHCGYVVRVTELRKHSNADKLNILTCFGNETAVSLDVKVGDLGIYFPSGLQLSAEFCDANHLCRKTQSGEPDTGYMEPDKRNVKTIKLRGEASDGIYCGIQSLAPFGDISQLNVGDCIDIFNGHEICTKYIPRVRASHSGDGKGKNSVKKIRENIVPLFAEHVDTNQLEYNLAVFKPGDQIEITLKMHGTSQRTGYLPMLRGYKRTLWDKIYRRKGKPIYEWSYVTGSRRVVLNDFTGGFYGSNQFREPHAKFFEGKLWKGETVYYEVVGYTETGTPIMGSCNNSKIQDKNFTKQYGPVTEFSYGCESGQSDFYIYRITLTNEDGDVIEYTPDFMRYRCEQMGAKCVPVFWRGFLDEPDDWTQEDFNPGEYAKSIAQEYYDGPDPVGKTHVREGVVVRIVNRPKFEAYKLKNFSFKALSGIITDQASENAVLDEDIASEL